ncbi:MAG: hypothetical protein GEU74_07400 [Nitriliruptorales bacterium]|nr:hypothetical protein [Nitriliruptorales bacterium]
MRVRYGRWTGTQDPFPADVSADDVLDAIGDDVLEGLSPDEALNRLLQRGLSGRASGVSGLAGLRRRVEEARRRELQRMGLEGPLREIERRLGEIVDAERAALDLAGEPATAAAHHAELDMLPSDVAGRVAALQHYDWFDQRAAAAFTELMQQLQRDAAEATFGRLAGALQSMDGDSVQRTKDMLAELNDLVDRRQRGEDVDADFRRFRARYGDALGSDAESLDELLEDLARRMAAMSRLLAGMTPDQRAQLSALSEQLLGDIDLSFQADRLRRSLQSSYPGLGWDSPVEGGMPTGDSSGSLSGTVEWMERLQEYEDLAQALGQDYPGARLDDIDETALRRAVGDEGLHDLRALREVERVLEEAGAAGRHHGRLELTPHGIRRLGQKSLAHIYRQAIDGGVGSHRALRTGGDGEPTGATRTWQFGDPFRIDITRTIRNATLRAGQAGTSALRPTGVSLTGQDFELAEAEQRVRVATVLLLDMSFSMPLRGNWVPAKRVALALQSLIDGQFPEDRFYVVGFSDFARRLQPRDLVATGWEPVMGTNMQHAFLMARRLLGAHPDAQPQVIMVTDGEPTAHLEGAESRFAWPPEPETLRLALLEARRLARAGATLNVFLLDHDPGAATFIERMVQACSGRIFYPDLDDLGQIVVRDFLTGRGRPRAG